MKRAGLCMLGLLCLHSWVQGQELLEAPPEVLVFCDDPAVKQAVNDALNKFNDKVFTGHKMALYQILSAGKSENASGSVYSIKFSSRRSDCPAGDNKPWRDCRYLADDVKEPRSCNATVYVTERETDTMLVECNIDPVLSERAPCLGCPEDIDENSEDLKVPLSTSISKYNSLSDSLHFFVLNSVGTATRQVVAGLRYTLSFDMRKSNCAKAEHTQLSALCVPHPDDVELVNCNSTVDVAPWRHQLPEANVECGPGPLPAIFFTRRRPPGWSPLRNVIDMEQVPTSDKTPKSTPVNSAPVSAAIPAKEESSEEEDAAASSKTAPFHCPSKPWKKFFPRVFIAPPPVPPAEGAFTDRDLLG